MKLSSEELRKKYRISARVVTEMVRGGFVRPERGERRQYLFSFQDIQLLKMAQDLYAKGISPSRTARFLQQLTESRSAQPISGRLRVSGRELVVREGESLRTPGGQLVIDFEHSGAALVRALPGTPSRSAASVHAEQRSAEEWFLAALYAERAQPEEARRHYEQAIALHPCYADAYINLCCLLVDRSEWEEARRLCERAVKHCPDSALLHYNLGVVLEEHEDLHGALEAYRCALALDPDLADAHHNLGILLDSMGERAAAIRHLREYRKLS